MKKYGALSLTSGIEGLALLKTTKVGCYWCTSSFNVIIVPSFKQLTCFCQIITCNISIMFPHNFFLIYEPAL